MLTARLDLEETTMPKLDLTDRFIATLKPQEKAADYFDTKAKGLNLRISPTGVKAWSVRFTSPRRLRNGRPRSERN